MRYRYLSGVIWTVAICGLFSGGCASRRSSPPPVRDAGHAAPAKTAESAKTAEPPKTAEDCRACGGEFGTHGINPTPRCICGTRDAGRRCKAKEDCEGDCVADGKEKEVTEPGPPPRGYFIGRCSKLRTTFGCHLFLGPRSGPVRLDEPPEQQLCVD